MRVFIQTQGLILSADEQAHIRQRLKQMLGRFDGKAFGATLHLRDINGPRGGEDKDCQLVVELEDTTTVIHDRGTQVRAVVERTLHRAVHAVTRQLSRIRNRHPLRAPHLGKGRGPGARNRRMERALDALPGSA